MRERKMDLLGHYVCLCMLVCVFMCVCMFVCLIKPHNGEGLYDLY